MSIALFAEWPVLVAGAWIPKWTDSPIDLPGYQAYTGYQRQSSYGLSTQLGGDLMDDSLNELNRRLGGPDRTDLIAVDRYWPALTRGDLEGSISYRCNLLFWNIFSPRLAGQSQSSQSHSTAAKQVPPLHSDVETELLARLEQIERDLRSRVEFVPDQDPESLPCSVYIRIGAARAFALKRRDGYSDDVRDCLKRVWVVAVRLHRLEQHQLGSQSSLDDWNPGGGEDDFFRLRELAEEFAITALVLRELFRISRLDGDYCKALGFLTSSLRLYSIANRDCPGGICSWEKLVRLLTRAGRIDEDPGMTPNPEDELFGESVGDLSEDPPDGQAAVDVGEHVLLRGCPDINWKQVAEDFKYLAWSGESQAEGLLVRDINDTVKVEGHSDQWFTYWLRAAGRAQQKLSPSELLELRQMEQAEGSRTRLIRYFFGSSLWQELPKRAQQALIDADNAWLSGSEGRIESVLNDLKVATEALCYSLIWERLEKAGGGQQYLEFVERQQALASRGHHPSLADYGWTCRRPFFEGFVTSLGFDKEDMEFLTGQGRFRKRGGLSSALNELNKLRAKAEHEHRRRWKSDEIGEMYRVFLGIGHPGILPRLARISLCLKQQRGAELRS